MVFGDESLFISSYWASRFNSMYRQQQDANNGYPVPGSPSGNNAPPGTAPGTGAVTGWFQTATQGYHPHVPPHQGMPEAAAAAAAAAAATAAATGTAYCMNADHQTAVHQMWQHHHPMYSAAGGDFTDFHQQHHHQQQQLLQDGHHHHHHHHNHHSHHPHQDMSATAGSSPPMTISGSDMSAGSPGTAGVGPVSPHLPSQAGRPPPVRSPYEWIKKSAYQNQQPNPGKTRTKDKYRVVYTDHQRVELEKEFYYSRYITIRRKTELANNLGLSERQVKIWFQNRRAKERKQVKKREEFSHKDNIMMDINHVTQQAQQQLHQQLSAVKFPPITMDCKL